MLSRGVRQRLPEGWRATLPAAPAGHATARLSPDAEKSYHGRQNEWVFILNPDVNRCKTIFQGPFLVLKQV